MDEIMEDSDSRRNDEDDSIEKNPANSNCFTILQSRNLAKSLPSVGNLAALCSSMDLVALGLGTPAVRGSGIPIIPAVENIHIHRTISWQRLLVLGPSELSGSTRIEPLIDFDVLANTENISSKDDTTTPLNPSEANAATISHATNDLKGATCLAWSPDGRALAIGLANGQVLLFQIESTGPRLVHATAKATFRCSDTTLEGLSPSTGSKGDIAPSLAEGLLPAATKSTILTRSRARAIQRQQLLRQKNRQQYQKQQHQLSEEKMNEVQKNETALKSTALFVDSNISDPQVVGLCWAKRISRPIYSDQDSLFGCDDEQIRDEAWLVQCRYLSRAPHFLPHEPCYEMLDASEEMVNLDLGRSSSSDGRAAHSHLDWNGTSGPPSAFAPLSVLCVAGVNNSLSLYLHGRYRIATIGLREDVINKASNVSTSTQIVCSLDLSTVLMVTSSGSIILHDFPQLALKHHELSWISSSYSFVAANVYKAHNALSSALSGWKDTIRPIEGKLLSLHELLHQYGVIIKKDGLSRIATVRSELLNYILLGYCTSNREGSAEACIQFFANLSEFAMQRLGKTIESGIVSIENRIRSSLKSSGQALVYAASEIYGMARSSIAACGSENLLLDSQRARQALEASERLCVVIEQCLVDIIRIRHIFRDFFAWLVWEVLSVKAEGTAVDSSERQHAMQKRPPQAVRERVAAFLSDAGPRDNPDSGGQASETERLVGLRLSEYFANETVHTSDKSGRIAIPSLRLALRQTKEAFHSLFATPREVMNQTAKSIAVKFSVRKGDELILPSVHKRFSYCDTKNGGFQPNLINKGHCAAPLICCTRNWILLAQGKTASAGGSIIQVVALPSIVYDEDFDEVIRPSYYLNAFIELPKRSRCVEVAFYGDDGNSSLSAFRDVLDPSERSSPEGRQSLCILVEIDTAVDDDCRQKRKQELWLFPYEKLRFKIVDCKPTNNARTIEIEGLTQQDCLAKISFSSHTQVVDEDVTLCPRKRKISTAVPDSILSSSEPTARRMVTSGSRGVVCIVNKNIVLSLLDVEEDEEVENSDDENGILGNT